MQSSVSLKKRVSNPDSPFDSEMKQYLPLICLALHRSSQPIRIIQTPEISFPKSQPNPESIELVEVLRRATTPDRMVILTIVHDAWTGPASVLDLFLDSFRIGQGTKYLLNHLLIVTVCSQAYQYCKSLHFHCFQLTLTAVPEPAKMKQLLEHRQDRNELLHKVIDLGYNLIFTADVMWLRNPIFEFNVGNEVTIPCDMDSKNRRNKQDRGLFYVKSTARSVEFFRYLKLVGILYPKVPLGSFCEIVTQQEMMEILGMSIEVLDTTNFGGFRQPIKKSSEVYTMQANCFENLDSKLHGMKLVLDDWSNFTGGSYNISRPFSSWRAPEKCIQ